MSEVKSDQVLPQIKLEGFSVTTEKCIVPCEYFMTDEDLKKNHITGWYTPGSTGPPVKAYGFYITLDSKDKKSVEELDAKLRPFFVDKTNKNYFAYNVAGYSMNEVVTPEEVKIVDKPGFAEILAAMRIAIPNLTADELRELRFSSNGEYPSKDHEYNTHLVNVIRTPAVVKSVIYNRITIKLTWDDYYKIKDKLDSILLS